MPESIGGRRAESQVLPILDLVQLVTAPLITGNDVDCPAGTRGLLVGTAGALSITVNGNDHNLVPLQAGIIPIYCERIRVDPGNVAGNIWAVL